MINECSLGGLKERGVRTAFCGKRGDYKKRGLFQRMGLIVPFWYLIMSAPLYPASTGPSIFLDKSGRGRDLSGKIEGPLLAG